MYKIVEWSPEIDLSKFYSKAKERGFVNNSNQKIMIDCFRLEKEWNAWILYDDSEPIGSVVAHSFDDVMGEGSYRVLSRCCILKSFRKSLGRFSRLILEHQNFTDQFLLPICIEWAGKKNIYATSNQSNEASQNLVHKYYFPLFEKAGLVERVKETYYRNTKQTIWKIDADAFLSDLKNYPRWS